MFFVRKYLIIRQLYHYTHESLIMYKTAISLRDIEGQRKYLNQTERLRFLGCTKGYRADIKLFCQLLYYTGARIAEIHNLKLDNIDFSNKSIVIESLKKRKKGVFREIPLPECLLHELQHYIQELNQEDIFNSYLFSFSLRTASRIVKRMMTCAKITGIQSCARGLRHGFAVHAVTKVPITMVKKWLGHASLETTEIYLDVVGIEEREIAKRIW